MNIVTREQLLLDREYGITITVVVPTSFNKSLAGNNGRRRKKI